MTSIPFETPQPRHYKCYDVLVPKIIKVAQTPKTIAEIKRALGVGQNIHRVDETVYWMEANGRLNIAPDKNNEPTFYGSKIQFR